MEEKIHVAEFQSPFGELVLGSLDNQLVLCDWKYRKMRQSINRRIATYFQADFEQGDTQILDQAKKQLQEYFEGSRVQFDLKLRFAGTAFQKKVWHQLLTIPYGNTRSYLHLAKQMGDPKAIRAIASANGANAHAIIVPCHRIVGSDGSLVGYAGGLSVKNKLLTLECGLQQQSLF